MVLGWFLDGSAYLSLWVFRTQTGGSKFDDVGEFSDGAHGRLGGLGQFLLTGSGARHQQLGVLHQSLGCLQDALSAERKG